VLSAPLGVESDAPEAGSSVSYRSLTRELLLLDASNRYQDAQSLWAEGGGPPD
jgi:hypothetical protein